MRQEKGFTLVEILISIAVGMVVLLAVYAAVVTGQRSTSGIERKVMAGQDTRAAMELMTIEIQMASFDPTMTPGMWRDPLPGTCGAVAANQANRGIQAASATSISVETDVNETGAIGDASNEIITYNYDAANQYITRSTNCGSALPFLGDTEASGRPRAVRVINTTAVPVFRYFNGLGAELTSFPGDISSIARIEITLWVETEDVDPNTQQRRRFIYSTSVIPRNHVIGMQ